MAHFEIVGFADTLLIHYYLLLITYCRRQYWHARRDSLNQGVARSSPRKQCSPALHFIVRVQRHSAKKCGTPGGTRTPGLLLRRQLLYPAELLAHFFGAGDGNRTRVTSLEGWCPGHCATPAFALRKNRQLCYNSISVPFCQRFFRIFLHFFMLSE